jgi:hypothetical protein
VHKYMRTRGSEGATEPGGDGPGSVGPVRPAWSTPGSVRPPLLAPEDPSTLSSWRRHHSQAREPFASRGHPQVRERERREIVRKKDRSTRRKHPQVEKKEDTVGSVTMINGAMSSTLMGQSSHLSKGCNRS